MKVPSCTNSLGERTRLACRLRRLAGDPARGEEFLSRNKISQKRLFGEAPKSAREARALPRRMNGNALD